MTDALPVRHNITAFSDTSVSRVFRWLVDGETQDLTGWNGRLQIGLNGSLYTEVHNGAIVSPGDGTVIMGIPAGTLTEPGTYTYALDLIDPNGEPTRLVIGTIKLTGLFAW